MASSIQGMIEELGRNIEALAGSKVKDKVMEGSQTLSRIAARRRSGSRVR